MQEVYQRREREENKQVGTTRAKYSTGEDSSGKEGCQCEEERGTRTNIAREWANKQR